MGLEDACEKALRVEEATEPVGVGISIVDPLVHEIDSLLEVSEPTGQRFERRIGGFFPEKGDSVVKKGLVDAIENLAHRDEALDSCDQIFERDLYGFYQIVEPLAFLDQHCRQRRH